MKGIIFSRWIGHSSVSINESDEQATLTYF